MYVLNMYVFWTDTEAVKVGVDPRHIQEALSHAGRDERKEKLILKIEQARKATSNVSIEERLEQLESNVTKEIQEIKAAIREINTTLKGAIASTSDD